MGNNNCCGTIRERRILLDNKVEMEGGSECDVNPTFDLFTDTYESVTSGQPVPILEKQKFTNNFRKPSEK